MKSSNIWFNSNIFYPSFADLIRTGDPSALAKVAIPETALAIDNIRPDLLIYRCWAKCLILWESGVEPTHDWIMAGVPQVTV